MCTVCLCGVHVLYVVVIESNINVHHYECIALYDTSSLQTHQAASITSCSPTLNVVQSSVLFLSKVEHSRLEGLQSTVWVQIQCLVHVCLPIYMSHVPNSERRHSLLIVTE